MPKKPELSPFNINVTPFVYGHKIQLIPDKDTSAPLSPECLKWVQKIVGLLLYYARTVNNKLLVILIALSAHQAKGTMQTEQLVETLLNYVATYPSDGITYRASDMGLCAHADAGYLNETKTHSRAGAHIYHLEDDPIPRFNGGVLTIPNGLHSWRRLFDRVAPPCHVSEKKTNGH
jgi:hypothetical protein